MWKTRKGDIAAGDKPLGISGKNIPGRGISDSKALI